MSNTPDMERGTALLAALPADIRALALQTLEHWSERDPYTGPFGWQIGLHYTERAPGRTSCAIDVNRTHYNPGNIAHGGVVFTLADSAMGAAVFTMLQPGQRCVTAELKLNYLAPVLSGVVTATAQVITMGRKLAVVTAEVRDTQSKLVGLAQGTFAIIQPEEQRPVGGDR